MVKLSVEEILKSCGGRLLESDRVCNDVEDEDIKGISINKVSTDSRDISEGALFIPIVGERFDGHDFIKQVVRSGARGFLTDRHISDSCLEKSFGILVDDTTEALQDLAAYYLKRSGVISIGVTGSTGKTTTKDMLHAIFSTKYKTHKTLGNFNNHIGLPITIFNMPDDSEAIILEMGMDKKGEIHRLAKTVHPEIAVITNIGDSHIENLGSRENIFKAKMEIVDFFDSKNSLIIFSDDDWLGKIPQKDEKNKEYEIIRCGKREDSDYIISDIKDRGIDGVSMDIYHDENRVHFDLKVPAVHNCYNAALAVAAAGKYGICMKDAKCGLSNLKLTDKRLTVKDTGRYRIIDDSYNASPSSVKSALEVLANSYAKNKAAILGDMLELGKDSAGYHKEIGEYAANIKDLLLITIGDESKEIYEGATRKSREISNNEKIKRAEHFNDREELKRRLPEIIEEGSLVLVKGSNGMKMYEFIDVLIGEGQ